MKNPTPMANVVLWILQSLLAALFLFAGVSKLTMPAAALEAASPLPAGFLQFVGACEALGALGLVLPGVLRVGRELAPIAAAGLAVIMAGAVVVTLATFGLAPALVPFATGVLAAIVARGRGLAAVLDGSHRRARGALRATAG